MRARLRRGVAVTDEEFDAVYPPWVQRASDIHWTPCDVARRAAELLVEDASTRVLDVGSGAGKLCVIGSLSTDATFYGVEQREPLVGAAEHAARQLGASRCHFIHGDMAALDWTRFDAFYFYNPFYEHVAELTPAIDPPLDFSPERYAWYVTVTGLKLCAARVGTRVVTYQGYGGTMPSSYRLVLRERAGCDHLELWRKEAPSVGASRPEPAIEASAC
jgi:hypothetical protein